MYSHTCNISFNLIASNSIYLSIYLSINNWQICVYGLGNFPEYRFEGKEAALNMEMFNKREQFWQKISK